MGEAFYSSDFFKSFFFIFDFFELNYMHGYNVIGIYPLLILRASWVCDLESDVTLGNFSVVNISSVPFSFFWYSHYVYVTPFVYPQSLDILFCFVFVIVLFTFQFSRILLIDPLAQRFLSHVLYTESIKGILHFCYSGFHLWYFFLVLCRISISIFMLFICFCLLFTLSFSPRVAWQPFLEYTYLWTEPVSCSY